MELLGGWAAAEERGAVGAEFDFGGEEFGDSAWDGKRREVSRGRKRKRKERKKRAGVSLLLEVLLLLSDPTKVVHRPSDLLREELLELFDVD